MYYDKVLHSAELKELGDLIPENYRVQIMRAELTAIATYDSDSEDKKLIGISVTGDHAGWLELVWIVAGEDYREPLQAADYVRYILRRAEKSGRYTGAFCEIHMDESTLQHKNILILAGMEIKETKNNIFEMAISEVTHEDVLMAAAEKSDCIFLDETPDEFIAMLDQKFAEDERPIPVPDYFAPEDYLQELSVICIENDEPVGALLFSEEKDYLVLDLAFSVSPKAMPAMVGTALKRAKELYPEDKRILMPIVGKGAKEIIEKLAPDAERGDIMEAVIWFEKREMPKALKLVMDQLTGKVTKENSK
jgi:hypothetical protein